MSEETASPPQIKFTWLLGTVAAFAVFALIGGYSSRMTQTYTDYDQDRATQRYANLAQVRADENKLLYPLDENKKPTAEWVDQDKGIVRIPIDEAMSREIDTLKAQQPAAGCEIPGSVTAPAPAPAVIPIPEAAPVSTNAAPVNAAPPAPAKPGAPATKPAKPAKPVKTTLLTPGNINQPVFNLRRVNPADTQAFKGFINYGVRIAMDNNAASSAPAAPTNK